MKTNEAIAMLDPQRTVADFEAAALPDNASIRQALTPSPGTLRFALGRNEHARALLDRIGLDGVVDDFAAPGEWNGIPVVSGNDVPAGAIVINCSMSISPLSAGRRIAALSDVRSLCYADLYRDPASPVPLPAFVAEARAALSADKVRFAALFERFADCESQETFNRIMAYRLTADPAHMQGFRVRMQEQYFEPFLGPMQQATFVDCGGYDGDTSEIFAARYPDYARIHLFEPSAANMQKARIRLARTRDVDFVPLGVSDVPGILRFDADAGSASAVSGSGEASIEVTTIDTHIRDAVHLIKMDLEGWELSALKGAQTHIRTHTPALAIAVYHRIGDFLDIPEYVLGLHPQYDVYLRHYTEGWSETVMYFIPRSAH